MTTMPRQCFWRPSVADRAKPILSLSIYISKYIGSHGIASRPPSLHSEPSGLWQTEHTVSRSIQAHSLHFHVRLRIAHGATGVMGPGKAALLESIRDTGSISAAARHLGMSYRRAWMLTEDLNRLFRMPLVETARGGARGGGARLTPLGEEALACYRQMENRALGALEKDAARFAQMVAERGDSPSQE